MCTSKPKTPKAVTPAAPPPAPEEVAKVLDTNTPTTGEEDRRKGSRNKLRIDRTGLNTSSGGNSLNIPRG